MKTSVSKKKLNTLCAYIVVQILRVEILLEDFGNARRKFWLTALCTQMG